MSHGNGGFWNRAGRRSGGDRPVTIVVPPVQSRGDLIRVRCDQCSNDNLPRLVTSGCRGCQEVVAMFAKMTREERDALYDMQVRATAPDYCQDCDGCGWYEGGPALKTTCEKCGGTGVTTPNGL